MAKLHGNKNVETTQICSRFVKLMEVQRTSFVLEISTRHTNRVAEEPKIEPGDVSLDTKIFDSKFLIL